MQSLRWKSIRKQLWGYYFVLPSTVLFIFFVLWPSIGGVINGFYEYNIGNRQFIGFENYLEIWNDPIAIKTIINTLQYVVIIVPVVMTLSFFISLIIYKRGIVVKSYVRAVFYLPAVVPSVCLAVLWKWLYNPNFGLLNSFIVTLGGEPVNFLGDPNIAIYSVMFIVITWTLGQPIILFTASLGGIPSTLLEAAEIDGANGWKKNWYITIPLLKPVALYVMLTLTIGIMQVVEAVMLTTNGGPYYASNTMLLMIYNEAFKLNNLGYASALGNIMMVLIFIMAYFQFRYFSSDIDY